MKVKFDFNLSAWVQNLVIEGVESLEEAKEQLGKMSISDILDNCDSYVKSTEIKDLDAEIIASDAKYKVFNIVYDEDCDSDILPKELEVKVVDLEKDRDIKVCLTERLWDELGYDVDIVDFDFEELKEGE